MLNSKKVVAIVEARMTSSRFPGKVLLDYCGLNNLQHIVNRLRRSQVLDDVVIATTVNPTDDPIVRMCEQNSISFFRGDEEDVLLRVLNAAQSVDGELIVEVTGDCPIADWRIVDQVAALYVSGDYDYVSNVVTRTYPRGLDIQLFSTELLEVVNKMTQNPIDHEHVSLFIYTHPELFKLGNLEAPQGMWYPEVEITLDTREDYELINAIYEELYPVNPDFSAEDVISLLMTNDELYRMSVGKSRKDPFREQKEWLDKNHGEL